MAVSGKSLKTENKKRGPVRKEKRERNVYAIMDEAMKRCLLVTHVKGTDEVDGRTDQVRYVGGGDARFCEGSCGVLNLGGSDGGWWA